MKQQCNVIDAAEGSSVQATIKNLFGPVTREQIYLLLTLMLKKRANSACANSPADL